MLNSYTIPPRLSLSLFFFFNDTATTEIYTLSLHDALPISLHPPPGQRRLVDHRADHPDQRRLHHQVDRKSTRLNSSHQIISYAVFCLKKKKNLMLPHLPSIVS